MDLLLSVDVHGFLVHTDVLSNRNAEFKKIIDDEWDKYDPEIRIEDVDHLTFKNFLKFVYNGWLEKSAVSEGLLKLALKYNDQKLKEFCEDVYLQTLDEENAVYLLNLAIRRGCEKLKAIATSFIVVRYKKMKERDDYHQLLKNSKAANLIIEAFYEKLQKAQTSMINIFFEL